MIVNIFQFILLMVGKGRFAKKIVHKWVLNGASQKFTVNFCQTDLRKTVHLNYCITGEVHTQMII